MGSPQGVGIGLRRNHYDALLETGRQIDWLEYVPENFVFQGGFRRRAFDACCSRFPLVAHGVSLSVGGPDPLNFEFLGGLKELLRQAKATYFSDHLCFSSAGGHAFHDLLPLPFSEEAVKHTADRARQVADFLELPLVLENITYYAEMPGASMSEGEFVSAVLQESGAGLLLDVNNAYLNAVNHGREPLSVLEELPLERVRHIHLAGHVRDGDVLLDNHGTKISDPVWALYKQVLRRTGPQPTLIEWDTNIPSLDRVLDEADAARVIYQEVEQEGLKDSALPRQAELRP